MSDLQKKNVEAMISTANRFDQNVAELRLQITALNAKVSSLTNEVASIKKENIMAAVKARMDATGHGGTD